MDVSPKEKQPTFPINVVPHDEEKGAPYLDVFQPGTTTNDVEAEADPFLVTFDGPDDPINPLNWPLYRKWAITLLSSLGGLVTLMSGSMMAPALSSIGHDLHMNDAETNLALSIFVFAFAVGPLVMAPLSEVYGRRPIWLYGSIWYIIWNTVCGFARNKPLMIVARLLGGSGASGEYALSAPILSDVWRPEQRGKSFAISTFVPLLGPAIGPIIGGIITGRIGWHWLFWVISIFEVILVLATLIIFHEPYAPKILSRKAAQVRESSGNPQYTTLVERFHPKLSTKLSLALSRPVRLLLTQPIIQLMSLYLAYNFGILFIVVSTFATLWTSRYHQSVSVSGLHYIAFAIGYTIAAQVGGPLTDRIWAHLKSKSPSSTTAPEFRVPLMIPGVVLIPLGLFLYGWSADAQIFWLVPDIGIGIFGCGIILGTQAMQAYVMDAYPEFTASAVAASQLLRGLAAFGFPIFAPAMYVQLGYAGIWVGQFFVSFCVHCIGCACAAFLVEVWGTVESEGEVGSVSRRSDRWIPVCLGRCSKSVKPSDRLFR